jgi:Zn-finger nucleic acid-binding protein
MDCPVDGNTLVMSERQGIEIDYCPKCRGVWLDRGELDKIIERNEREISDYDRDRDRDRDRERDRDRDARAGHGGHGKKRKSSLLGDLFELGG